MMRIVKYLVLPLISHLFSAGCPSQRGTPDLSGTVKPDTIPKLSIADPKGKKLLFSFFDHRAELRTVERRTEVEHIARAEVMVTDPAISLPGDLVYVADLRQKNKDGEYKVWVKLRSEWLDRNMPKISVLSEPLFPLDPNAPRPKRFILLQKKPQPPRKHAFLSKLLAVRKKPANVASAGEETKKDPAEDVNKMVVPEVEAPPKVILFSTAWCPACKSARQYLESRSVGFVELDVEKNQLAAQQYQEIQKKFGLRPGVIPLLIINGRVIQGASKSQIDAALAAGSTLSRGVGQSSSSL